MVLLRQMFQRFFASYSTQAHLETQSITPSSTNPMIEENNPSREQDTTKQEQHSNNKQNTNQTNQKGINEQLILQLYQQVDTLQKDLQHAKSSYQHVYEQYTKCQQQQQHTIQTQVEHQVQQHAQYVERLEKQTIQQEKHIEHLQKILHDLQCTR